MPHEFTSAAVVNATRQLFAEQGVPERIISDNGRHFDSSTYREFATQWGFNHETSSPNYPRSNGFIQRMIQTVKNTLKKAKASGIDPNMALLCIRATPIDSCIPSPAELLYGRKMKNNLPVRIPNNASYRDNVYRRLQQRQETQKYYHDKSAHDLPPLTAGQLVRVQDHRTGHWFPATVRDKLPEPRSYLVETPNGRLLRRNRKQRADARHRLPHRDLVIPAPNATPEDKATAPPSPLSRQDSPPHADGPNITHSGRHVKKPNRLTY
ncbi:uncharacterized protein K02A2.6-like [Lytechinus pictus]|uniref:uncharacterized protein K02A2.6-like n=1 Tax=Lytechinus pictus TaxID=7653 RepID=UPI0030BA058A